MTVNVAQVNQNGNVSNNVQIASGVDLQIIEIINGDVTNLGVDFPVSPTDGQLLTIVITGGVVAQNSMSFIAPYAIPDNSAQYHSIAGFELDLLAMNANNQNYFWTTYRYAETTDTWYKVA